MAKRLRVLLVADEESKYIWDHFDRSRFKGVDVIISCGDLKASYLSFLTTMVAAPLLYVPGNHDGEYLHNPPEGCDDLTEKMVIIKGVRFIGFGGAHSRSPKPFHYTEKDLSRQVVRRLPEICMNGGFDVLVTHAPAEGLGDGSDTFHKGFRGYLALIHQFKPVYHLHGHQHLNYDRAVARLEYKGTKVINGFGYQLIDMEVPDQAVKRLSYLKTRYDLVKEYGRII